MTKKMTTGEIAKKVGISQKAVRLYDEKGLLKPSEYSEGNYRLYDKEALLVLEKIIALKQVGFSLEEIKENLIHNDNDSILETLQSQIDMMEAKRYELEKAITRIKAAIARSNGKPDWDDVADIIRDIQADQKADEGHFHALKHNADGEDWYVKIYRSLGIKEGERVLDLGCGFSKVWRNNWTDIPANVTVDGYDLPESWAEDFFKFIMDNNDTLATGTNITVYWDDVEKKETWDALSQKEPYSMAIAHYIMDVLHDEEAFVANVATRLSDGGMFSVNNICASAEQLFWIDAIKASGLNPAFAQDKYNEAKAQGDTFKLILEKYFKKITEVVLPSPFRYESAEELFERAMERFPEAKDYLEANKLKLTAYFDNIITEQGEIIIDCSGLFWHCYK